MRFLGAPRYPRNTHARIQQKQLFEIIHPRYPMEVAQPQFYIWFAGSKWMAQSPKGILYTIIYYILINAVPIFTKKNNTWESYHLLLRKCTGSWMLLVVEVQRGLSHLHMKKMKPQASPHKRRYHASVTEPEAQVDERANSCMDPASVMVSFNTESRGPQQCHSRSRVTNKEIGGKSSIM